MYLFETILISHQGYTKITVFDMHNIKKRPSRYENESRTNGQEARKGERQKLLAVVHARVVDVHVQIVLDNYCKITKTVIFFVGFAKIFGTDSQFAKSNCIVK